MTTKAEPSATRPVGPIVARLPSGLAPERAALTFGAANARVAIAGSDALSFRTADDFTVEVMVRPDAAQGGGLESVILDASADGSAAFPFALSYHLASHRVVASRSDGNEPITIRSTQPIDDGQFHHIAFVKQGSQLTLLVDGQATQANDLASAAMPAAKYHRPAKAMARGRQPMAAKMPSAEGRYGRNV